MSGNVSLKTDRSKRLCICILQLVDLRREDSGPGAGPVRVSYEAGIANPLALGRSLPPSLLFTRTRPRFHLSNSVWAWLAAFVRSATINRSRWYPTPRRLPTRCVEGPPASRAAAPKGLPHAGPRTSTHPWGHALMTFGGSRASQLPVPGRTSARPRALTIWSSIADCR